MYPRVLSGRISLPRAFKLGLLEGIGLAGQKAAAVKFARAVAHLGQAEQERAVYRARDILESARALRLRSDPSSGSRWRRRVASLASAPACLGSWRNASRSSRSDSGQSRQALSSKPASAAWGAAKIGLP